MKLPIHLIFATGLSFSEYNQLKLEFDNDKLIQNLANINLDNLTTGLS